MAYKVFVTDYNLIVKKGSGELLIPLDHVEEARIGTEQDLKQQKNNDRVLIDYDHPEKVVVITLNDEQYDELIIEVDDPGKAIFDVVTIAK